MPRAKESPPDLENIFRVRPQEPASSSAHIADIIRMAILRGELRPGERLVERDLAGVLGVSKTPVREALKILSRGGLVRVSANRGAAVRAFDPDLARSVFDARLLVEPEAVRRAVPRHNASSLDAVRRYLREAADAAERQDRASLSLANRSLHRQLYIPCDNGVLVDFLDGLQDQLAVLALAAWDASFSYKEEASEHEEIVRAVEQRDSKAAKARLERHIERFAVRLLGALDPVES